MIYLLRHGDTRTNGVRRYIGRTDLPLSENGRRQVRWWRRELSHVPFHRVICSGLRRTRETAEIILGRSNAAAEIFPELGEIDLGIWDGLAMEEVRRRFPLE